MQKLKLITVAHSSTEPSLYKICQTTNLKIPRFILTNDKKQRNCSLKSDIPASVLGKESTSMETTYSSQINITLLHVSLSGPEMI